MHRFELRALRHTCIQICEMESFARAERASRGNRDAVCTRLRDTLGLAARGSGVPSPESQRAAPDMIFYNRKEVIIVHRISQVAYRTPVKWLQFPEARDSKLCHDAKARVRSVAHHAFTATRSRKVQTCAGCSPNMQMDAKYLIMYAWGRSCGRAEIRRQTIQRLGLNVQTENRCSHK